MPTERPSHYVSYLRGAHHPELRDMCHGRRRSGSPVGCFWLDGMAKGDGYSARREREVAQEPQGEPGTDFALSKKSGRLRQRSSRSCEEPVRRLALRPRGAAQIFFAPCIEYNICNITQISRDPYKTYFE